MKKHIREENLKKRDSLSDLQRNKKNDGIKKNLCLLGEFRSAKIIHCYISKDEEVETRKIIQNSRKNKIVLIPSVKNDRLISTKFISFSNLRKSRLGVLEPKNPIISDTHPDIILIPGIAFDRKGNRIGHGEGFYDRFLDGFHATKIGLAYDFQIVDSVPQEPHDIQMDYIVTDKDIIRCKDYRE